ncbi:MAG: thioredoxin family protein [Desulfobacterales bacterium]
MMTPHEKKQLLTLNDTLSKDVQIGLIESDHEKSRTFQQFCDKLTRLVPKIHVKKEESHADEIPTIKIHNGLRYQAVPSGTEIAPFIDALNMLDSNTVWLDEMTNAQLAKVELPTNLMIYISPQCKFCPQAVRQLLPLLALNSKIRLTVIDAMLFSEIAEMENIQSVPTLILEGHFRWSGSLQINEIIDVMKDRDPCMLGPVSLEMMLKEGKAGELAAMMLEKVQIFPAFYEVLAHPKWPVRLGAMVVMEELVENNLDLAAQILKPLWSRFHKVDNRVKGDLLYLFGQLRRTEIGPQLQAVLNGDYDPEVQEAAREALDKIRSA